VFVCVYLFKKEAPVERAAGEAKNKKALLVGSFACTARSSKLQLIGIGFAA